MAKHKPTPSDRSPETRAIAKAKEKMAADPALSDLSQMVDQLYLRVREIKARHRDLSSAVDGLEFEIHMKLKELRRTIDNFDERDRDLVTVLVVQGLEKMIDEAFA